MQINRGFSNVGNPWAFPGLVPSSDIAYTEGVNRVAPIESNPVVGADKNVIPLIVAVEPGVKVILWDPLLYVTVILVKAVVLFVAVKV